MHTDTRSLFNHHPLLSFNQISSKRDMSNDGEESPKSITSLMQDKDFILDCLCWHNEYRARHSAPALNVSPDVSTISANIIILLYTCFQYKHMLFLFCLIFIILGVVVVTNLLLKMSKRYQNVRDTHRLRYYLKNTF